MIIVKCKILQRNNSLALVTNYFKIINMKKNIILVFLLFSSIGSFAQMADSSQNSSNKSDTSRMVYTCPMHHEILSLKPGNCPKCGMELVRNSEELSPKQIYTCSMHPEIESDKLGNCPKCGMKLVKKKTAKKERMKKGGMCGMKMEDM